MSRCGCGFLFRVGWGVPRFREFWGLREVEGLSGVLAGGFGKFRGSRGLWGGLGSLEGAGS